jgi:hypothetical protein
MFISERNDWTPAANCKRSISRWGNEGSAVELTIYPAAAIRSMLLASDQKSDL